MHTSDLLVLALTLTSCGGSEVASVTPRAPDPIPAPTPASTPTADPPEPEPATGDLRLNPANTVGSVARAADYALSVVDVKECKAKEYFEPKPGNIKLGLELALENISDEEIPVNPFYAKLTDSEGAEYATAFGGCEPELGNSRIGSGAKTGGWITFEIPKIARGLRVTYSPIIIGKRTQPLVFDLGR